MSGPRKESALAGRLVEMLPLLAALNVNAVAHQRQIFALPLEALLGFIALKGYTARHSPKRMLLAGGALAALALVLQVTSAIAEPPLGPVPPILLGPLCAGLMGFAVFCAASRNTMYASVFAWMLAVLSLHGKADTLLLSVLLILGCATLASAYAQGGLSKQGLFGGALFGGFAALVGGGTLGLVLLAQASEGALMEALARIGRDVELSASVGLEDSLALRARYTARTSQRPLVEISGALPQRLRTTVLDRFDGRRWTPSGAVRPLSPSPAVAGAEARTELVFLEELAPYLPAPAGTRSIAGARAEPQPAGLFHAARLRGSVVALRRSRSEELPLEPRPPASLTEVPAELLEPFRAHASRLAPPAASPRELADRTEAWLSNGFVYSLTTDLSERGRHPLLVLLDEKRPAYCVWFASAMALLLRSRGVPARVVGGFAIGEVNSLTSVAMVRERDAHAWVEAWLDEGAGMGRWAAFDPTPWRSREQELGIDRSPGRLATLWGALAAKVRRLLAAPRLILQGTGLPVALSLVALLLCWRLLHLRRARKAAAPKKAARAADPQVRAAYQSYLQILARGARLSPGPSESDDELLDRLRASRGDRPAEAARQFLMVYREARFRPAGAKGDLQAPLAELRRALDKDLLVH